MRPPGVGGSSRFLVVLVVSLSIESLVLVFRVSHDAPEQLPYAASGAWWPACCWSPGACLFA